MIEKTLFPETKKISPDDLKKILQKPLEWEDAVCRCFCNQCQTLGEINISYAHGLIQTMTLLCNQPEIELQSKNDFKGYYFEISCCEICKKKESEISIKLKHF